MLMPFNKTKFIHILVWQNRFWWHRGYFHQCTIIKSCVWWHYDFLQRRVGVKINTLSCKIMYWICGHCQDSLTTRLFFGLVSKSQKKLGAAWTPRGVV
jgi:hypothetical protein